MFQTVAIINEWALPWRGCRIAGRALPLLRVIPWYGEDGGVLHPVLELPNGEECHIIGWREIARIEDRIVVRDYNGMRGSMMDPHPVRQSQVFICYVADLAPYA